MCLDPGRACALVVLVFGVAACSLAPEPGVSQEADAGAGSAVVDPDHHHADDQDEHQVRDPATQPCDAGNWQELKPDLRECRLAGATLDGQSLRRVDLSNAELGAASLEAADLFKAVLTDAAAAGADLDRANLTSADLSRADLTGASLRGTKLTNAKVDGAILLGALTDETTTCPAGLPGPCW
jgi:uncharacterized protein YjbI with pentapeptide repeats